MLIYPTLKMSPIQGMMGMGGGATGYLVGGAGGASELFQFAVNTEVTLRPSKWGSYGMSASDWSSLYNSISAPWYNVSGAVSSVTHPQENARSNPQAGVIMGLTGFPAGVYEFTLHGGGGADADPGFGAPGGEGIGRITITSSDIIYYAIGQGGIYTGGADRSNQSSWYFPNPGGWNGGGAAGAQNSANIYSGSGGGSTDIRLNGTDLSDRIMIAGGGGGSTDQNYMTGGAGGGFNQNGQDGGNSGNSNGAKGGTQSAGGSGALYNGSLYESYMSGSLWAGGRGYDGSNAVQSANAAGGGGGGYYGGGGAVDEGGANASGSGGGSGYADTNLVSNISATVGGASNGNPAWSLSNSNVNSAGYTTRINGTGGTVTIADPPGSNFDDSEYNSYQSNGTYINWRFGGNGKIKIKRIS